MGKGLGRSLVCELLVGRRSFLYLDFISAWLVSTLAHSVVVSTANQLYGANAQTYLHVCGVVVCIGNSAKVV